MTPVEIMNTYWKDIIIRVHTYNDSTKRVKHILCKCFNSEHSLNQIKLGKYNILNIILDAFNTYSNIYTVDSYIQLPTINIPFKEYHIPHQNALYESDKQIYVDYIHTTKSLMTEIYNQYIFLKPYGDISKLQYYCRNILKIMDKLLYAIDYVPVIPDKLII